ncbi:MAG: ornithine cyclodeaminase family protein [Armatimonadota bacterium]|nr:ornithine cyclodeaminase family protein [Armatimonadota bacterium]MDR5703965.1 ornithine cyclodeaminase family protein [Armatimonadota bacterium]
MRILTAAEVRQALPMGEAIAAVREAAIELSQGTANVPVRLHLPIPPQEGIALYMPAYLEGAPALGMKAVSVFPRNPEQGFPTIHAVVLLQDVSTGRPLALLEGAYLTALRTGAISGLATDLMARKDARVVALFGAGAQARTQLEAVATVRSIQEVRIVSRRPERTRLFAQEMAQQAFLTGVDVRVAYSPHDAVEGADIIITATTSPLPLFDGKMVKPGAHINAIGAFTPTTREVDSFLVKRARVVVDSRSGCLAEAGDLLIPIQEGVITAEHIVGELGEVALGKIRGREHADEITLFKSVGNAAFDVAVAMAVLAKAEQLGLGLQVVL